MREKYIRCTNIILPAWGKWQRIILPLSGEGDADAGIELGKGELGKGDAQLQLELRSLVGGLDEQTRYRRIGIGNGLYNIYSF